MSLLIYTVREKVDGLPEASIHNVDTGLTYLLEVRPVGAWEASRHRPAMSLTVMRPGTVMDHEYGFSPVYYGEEAFDFWLALLGQPFADKISLEQKHLDLSNIWAKATEVSLLAVQQAKEFEAQTNGLPF